MPKVLAIGMTALPPPPRCRRPTATCWAASGRRGVWRRWRRACRSRSPPSPSLSPTRHTSRRVLPAHLRGPGRQRGPDALLHGPRPGRDPAPRIPGPHHPHGPPSPGTPSPRCPPSRSSSPPSARLGALAGRDLLVPGGLEHDPCSFLLPRAVGGALYLVISRTVFEVEEQHEVVTSARSGLAALVGRARCPGWARGPARTLQPIPDPRPRRSPHRERGSRRTQRTLPPAPARHQPPPPVAPNEPSPLTMRSVHAPHPDKRPRAPHRATRRPTTE